MAERLDVTAPDGAYPIFIAPGSSDPLNRAAYGLDGAVVVVTNQTLAALYADLLARALPGAAVVTVPDGEVYKTLATMAHIYDGLVAAGMDRHGTVLAFGGGVIGDMAGFAAATYMRGVRLVQMPTSLLAMVDSSVGGKVGVDLPQGKNLVGAFKQPAAVLIDPVLLTTLPARERRCGMAEIIKHGLLADAGLLEWITRDPTPENDAALIARAVRVKIAVIQRDPYEQGERAYLNLGHTFGHAIETVSGYTIAHGEAVAIGLVAAAYLSEAIGLARPGLVSLVRGVVRAVSLPESMGDLDPEAVYVAMGTDKKKRAGRLRFVLLREPEQPVVRDDVDKRAVLDALEAVR